MGARIHDLNAHHTKLCWLSTGSMPGARRACTSGSLLQCVPAFSWCAVWKPLLNIMKLNSLLTKFREWFVSDHGSVCTCCM